MNTPAGPSPSDSPQFSLHDFAPAQESFGDALVSGLSAAQKFIPARFLYDEAGSELFDRICELPEYYPTRTELKILTDKADEIADAIGPDIALLEFGAGSSQKARLLLDALAQPAAYEPIDVSRQHLIRLAQEIADAYPVLAVRAICADYTQPLQLPDSEPRRRRAGFFPGSTIGNLTASDARSFLSGWAAQLGRDGLMIVGVALRAPASVVLPAYDDAQGVTARFTANVLVRANRELGAGFDVTAFRHTPDYDEATGHMTIHLTSLKAQEVSVGGRSFRFSQGERLHVEDSNKYAVEDFRRLARSAGYTAETVWVDPKQLFSVHVLRVA